MNAPSDTHRIQFVGPVAPETEMRPRLLGNSLGVPILTGIGDDNDHVAVPCIGCSNRSKTVIHVYRHRRIDGATFHTKAACTDGELEGRGIFVRVVKIVPGHWITAPTLF